MSRRWLIFGGLVVAAGLGLGRLLAADRFPQAMDAFNQAMEQAQQQNR